MQKPLSKVRADAPTVAEVQMMQIIEIKVLSVIFRIAIKLSIS
jgi:hypothetical protein